MTVGWNGRSSELAGSIGTTWGTEVAIGASDGIKVEKLPEMFGITKQDIEKSTSTAFPNSMILGNVEPQEITIEAMPRHVNVDAIDPLWSMFMATMYNTTTKTQQVGGDSALWLQGGTVASNHALQNQPTRFFSLSERIAMTSGYAYMSVPSYMPTGFKIKSEAGKPVTFEIKGIGNKVVKDSAVNGATQWNACTYNTNFGRVIQHSHLGTNAETGGTGGVWLLKSSAVGAGAPTFTWATAHTEPTSIEIEYDSKMKGVHTISAYCDSPEAEDVPEGTVTIKWHKAFDAFYSGILADLKSLESGTESDYLLRARWSFPTIVSAIYPYFEVQCARLRPMGESKFTVEAGKMAELEVKFQILAPTAYAHLPATFTGYNGGSNVYDALNVSVMNYNAAAVYLA